MRLCIYWSGPERITDYRSFRAGMVEPDYQAFRRDEGDLRLGLHSALSLYHLADWVWVAHEPYSRANFQWHQSPGGAQAVTSGGHFANALADLHQDFELVRAIGNAAKHLELDPASTTRTMPSNRPSHAANTYVETTVRWFGSTKGVVTIQGSNRPLLEVLTSTRTWWDALFARHGW